MNQKTNIEELSDAELVAKACEGDRQAFSKIVVRYQRLLCSLAYSALGSLNESEDIAQETFVEAWRKLDTLKDPEKLKSWLCGILRFKISHHFRKTIKQPTNNADGLQEIDTLESNEEKIETVAMREEEQALLWQALEAVPETYRETLVLYYREHRSVEHVACELDLTEDAVKQRLSRGRKLLQEKMMHFVEGALESSAPKKAFTAAVMAALVSVPPSAKAAGAGVTAVKAGSTLKWATILTFLGSFSGLISSFFALQASLDQTRTKKERTTVIRTVASFLGVCLGFVLLLFGLRYLALEAETLRKTISLMTHVSVIVFTVGFIVMTFRLLRKSRAVRSAEKKRKPELFESNDNPVSSKKREYKSPIKLLGVTLIHVKFDMAEDGDKPATGWIAAGDRAYGLLFAWGGFAVAPISVGIISIGLVTAGTVGFGIVGVGMIGVGILAIGASAIGYKAFGSLSSMGWESAFSQGFSLAREAAIGPISFAKEINNELASSILNLPLADQSNPIILGVIAVLVIVPVVWYSQAVRKRLRVPSLQN